MPHKQKTRKQIRITAARKGARTKHERNQLIHATHCLRLMRAGMTPQEIAVSENMPLREVLRLLRLATFIPHPIGRAIGLGATVAEAAFRGAEGAFGTDLPSFITGVRREFEKLADLGGQVEQIRKDLTGLAKAVSKIPRLP